MPNKVNDKSTKAELLPDDGAGNPEGAGEEPSASSRSAQKPLQRKSRSKRQIATSRANGRRSKGPVTATGKATSSSNALKHGMTSGRKVIDTESRDEYDEHQRRIRQTERPANGTEAAICEKFGDALWLSRRYMAAVASGIDYFVAQARWGRAQRRLRRAERNDIKELVERLERERFGDRSEHIIDPDGHERALRELDEAGHLLDDDRTLLGEAMIEGGLEYVDRLSRHFAQVDRSAERWIRQLRRDQKARGEPVEATPLVEVECTLRSEDDDDA